MEKLTYYGCMWYHRALLHISQEEVALRAGITTSYYGQIERGEANPTVDILERICAALEITMAELFTDPNAEEADSDDVSKRILRWLSDKSDYEKEVAFSLIKTAFKLKNPGKSPKKG